MAFSTQYPQAYNHLEQANLYEEAGDLDNALAECEKALEIDPCFSDALNLHGIVLEKLGYERKAISSYEKAIQFDPDFDEAKENLANLKERIKTNHGKTTIDKISNDLVTIATFTSPTEAHVYRTKLEAHGIPSFLADEHMVTMNWLYSTAIGGVKVQVLSSNVTQAIELLNEDIDIEQFRKDSEALPEEQPQCPRCRSFSANYETFNPKVAFISQILTSGIPIPFSKKKWRCNDCGYSWKWGEPLWPKDSEEAKYHLYKRLERERASKNKLSNPINVSKEELASDYYCTSCGNDVDEKWKACPHCGDSLEESNDKQIPAFTCPSCEEYVDENWETCPYCGEKLIEIAGYYCSKCGKDVEEYWKHCPNCGEPLDDEE